MTGRPRSQRAGTVPATAMAVRTLVRAAGDLLVPESCGGCQRPGTSWCAACAEALADDPIELVPRVDVGVPTWAIGRYRGPHRRAIGAMKEHGRRDLASRIGVALAGTITTLARWGELPDAPRVYLVPAPTRRASARRRGGDPVTAVADAAAACLGSRVVVAPLLVTASSTRDSAGLDARDRARNLSGAIRMRRRRRRRIIPDLQRSDANPPLVILVDDVLTTGATAAESIRVLRENGIDVHAVVVIAGA